MSWSLIKRLKIPQVCLNVLRLSIAFCILVVNFDVHIFLFSKCSLYLFIVSCHVVIAFDLCFPFFSISFTKAFLWIFFFSSHCFEHERLLLNLKREIKVVVFLLKRIYIIDHISTKVQLSCSLIRLLVVKISW